MARPLRLHIPGMPYHVVSRGNDKRCIFRDERDHLRFLERLASTLERFATACIAYCLMWNHFHLLVIPTEHSVSRLMQHLNAAYCGGFNRRHRRRGHLLEGRPTMRMVDTDAYLLTAVRYVLRNPVKAKKVKAAGDWRWSSYSALWGESEGSAFLSFDRVWTALNAPDAVEGRQRLKAFIEAETVGQGFVDLENSLLVGGETVGRQVDPLLPKHRGNPDFTIAERYATRPPLERFFEDAETQTEIENAAHEAFCYHAYTLPQIGELLGRPSATIWVWVQRAKGRAPGAPPGPRSPRRHPRIPPPRRGQISIFE